MSLGVVFFKYSGGLIILPDFSSGRHREISKASMTFRVTSLLVAQQRWASLQRAPVAGVPYLLALSKSSLNGVLGGQASPQALS